MIRTKTIHSVVLGSGKAIDDKQLNKINKYALVPLTAEQVYVRKYLMAHNGLDRDMERFHEDVLDELGKTLQGKGFFVEGGHPSSWSGKGGPGEGLFFDTSIQEMSPDEYQNLTNENIELPENIKKAKVLFGESYILKLDSNSDTLAKIDAGIYRFVSIGFAAKAAVEVLDTSGNRLYGEYRGRAEAREGSMVWLGAQQGASVMKQCETCENLKSETCPRRGSGIRPESEILLEGKKMLKKLGEIINKTLTEDNAIEEVQKAISEKDAKIKILESLADEGRAYRKHLVDDVLRFGIMIDEIPTDEPGQKKEAEFVTTWPIDRIKTLRDKYEVKARGKFPDKFTFRAKDENDRQAKDKEGEKNKLADKKDYTNPQHNELFETVGK